MVTQLYHANSQEIWPKFQAIKPQQIFDLIDMTDDLPLKEHEFYFEPGVEWKKLTELQKTQGKLTEMEKSRYVELL